MSIFNKSTFSALSCVLLIAAANSPAPTNNTQPMQGIQKPAEKPMAKPAEKPMAKPATGVNNAKSA